jgi:hypothetical protein
MDCGIDTNKYYPYHFDEIEKLLKDKPIFIESEKVF